MIDLKFTRIFIVDDSSPKRIHKKCRSLRDDPKLLDDGGETPKSQGRGWWFDSRLWNLMSTWQKLVRWSTASRVYGAGLATFRLNKKLKMEKFQ